MKVTITGQCITDEPDSSKITAIELSDDEIEVEDSITFGYETL